MTRSDIDVAPPPLITPGDGGDARRLHPFTVLFATIGLARQLILPAIVGGYSRGEDDPGKIVGWILGILAIPAVIIAGLRYVTFRYRVTRDELVIDSGVLKRQHRVIPLVNVQNIDLRESVLQRACGVVEMRVETAGSGRGAEASLEVLGRPDAEALREELLARRRTARAAKVETAGADADLLASGTASPSTVSADEPELPRRVLVRLSTGQLALAGATANEAGLIAAAVGASLQFVERFPLERIIPVDVLVDRLAESTVAGAIWLLLLTLGAVLVLGWVVSVIGSVVGYHDFTLERAGSDLRKQYGLIARRHTSVPLERVQGLRLEESLLRRPLSLASLKIETASGSPREQRRRGAEAFVPIATLAEVPALVRGVFEDLSIGEAQFHPVHPRSRRRAFLRHVFVLVALFSVVTIMAYVRTGVLSRALPLWVVALVAAAYGLAAWQYHHRGWTLLDGYALARSGVLNRITWVIPFAKIQTLHIVSTPFQRRHGLASLIIDTASGGRQSRIDDLDADTAERLMADLASKARSARRRRVRLPRPA